MEISMETENKSKKSASGLDREVFEKVVANLPLATYSAGEGVLTAGSKSGRLLILKKGAVAILKESVEIARVKDPGAVFGELSALLDQPHTADVRALEDSQFYVAEASLLEIDPNSTIHIARILARRLVAANEGLVELKNHLRAGHPPSALHKFIAKIEEMLVGSVDKRLQEPLSYDL
jgi:CRP/FNR family cyclic AMP-dependent transcriptional regulator